MGADHLAGVGMDPPDGTAVETEEVDNLLQSLDDLAVNFTDRYVDKGCGKCREKRFELQPLNLRCFSQLLLRNVQYDEADTQHFAIIGVKGVAADLPGVVHCRVGCGGAVYVYRQFEERPVVPHDAEQNGLHGQGDLRVYIFDASSGMLLDGLASIFASCPLTCMKCSSLSRTAKPNCKSANKSSSSRNFSRKKSDALFIRRPFTCMSEPVLCGYIKSFYIKHGVGRAISACAISCIMIPV